MKPLLFIGLDGVFSGFFKPKEHYMIAFGACAISVEEIEVGKKALKEKSSFYGAMTPPTKTHTFEKRCKEEFWDKNTQLLEKFENDAKPPAEVMVTFVEWVKNISEGYQVFFVVDCPADITWINYYLAEYADHYPLDTFFNASFTSQPYIADDAYRGYFNLLDAWGYDSKVEQIGNFKIKEEESHHPTNDTRSIIYRYVLFYIYRLGLNSINQ